MPDVLDYGGGGGRSRRLWLWASMLFSTAAIVLPPLFFARDLGYVPPPPSLAGSEFVGVFSVIWRPAFLVAQILAFASYLAGKLRSSERSSRLATFAGMLLGVGILCPPVWWYVVAVATLH